MGFLLVLSLLPSFALVQVSPPGRAVRGAGQAASSNEDPQRRCSSGLALYGGKSLLTATGGSLLRYDEQRIRHSLNNI